MFPENPRNGGIVAAVKFDETAPEVIATAAHLAHCQRRHLVLVHVYSSDLPVYSNSFAELTGGRGGPGAPTFVPQIGDHVFLDFPAGENLWTPPIEIARDHLARLAARSPVGTDTVLRVGDFPETLLAIAADRAATLIVTNAVTDEPGFLNLRQRSVRRLMAKARQPILILPNSAARWPVSERPLRLLVADDLEDSSLPALSQAAQLISQLGAPSDVLHVHVEAQKSAASASTIRSRDASLLAKLQARSAPMAQAVGSCGGTLRSELWHGRTEDELMRAAEVHRADVAIFGHHELLHREQLRLGHMSFGAMLGLGRAVLVAPPP